MLYLVRHGSAEDVGAGSDAERHLTPEGVRRTREVARALRTIMGEVDRIVSSPLVRARQTADIIAQQLGFEGGIEKSASLAPSAEASACLGALRCSADENIVLMGHMPHLAELASWLLVGEYGAQVKLKKASVCCFSCAENDWQAGGGCLEWLLQPSHFCELGKQ